MKVGVIGLGTMGMGAALNLLRKGFDVTGCELRDSARAEFAAAGGSVVETPDALPTDLEAIVVFVITAAQTEQVLFGENGCLSRVGKGAVVLCCATVAPEAARSLEKRITVACPMPRLAPVSSMVRRGALLVFCIGFSFFFLGHARP